MLYCNAVYGAQMRNENIVSINKMVYYIHTVVSATWEKVICFQKSRLLILKMEKKGCIFWTLL